MKTDPATSSSLYQEKKPRLNWMPRSIVLVVLCLFFIHFLNVFLQWTVIRRELAAAPAFRAPEYTFIGFSLFNQNKIAVIKLLPNAAPAGRIFAFFDLLHPAVFLVWNNDPTEMFMNLGAAVVAVPPGASRISFFPGSVFFLQQGNITAVRYFGDAIVGHAWHAFLVKNFLKGKVAQTPASFVVKALETTRYLKIPYLLYFFLPLLFIGAAVIHSGPVMLAAFFYYVEMFFLFDYRNLFVNVPFGWLFKSWNSNISDSGSSIFAAVVVIVFAVFTALGFWHWRKGSVSPRQKRLVLFFGLLPLALFF